MSRSENLTARLADHVAAALDRPLPPSASAATRHHALDTIAAMVAGSRLPAGLAGRAYAAERGGPGESFVVASELRCATEFAALANAMAAHADESDDSHELSKSHPGCSIVPTALAVAQERDPTGPEFLRAVALGYDVGPRVNMAAWPKFADVRAERRGTPTISGMFGSAATAAALDRLDADRVRVLLSYVAQQVGGMNTWKRDVEHVEKAYVLAGWPAFGALLARSFVAGGWSGVADVFDGDPNFIDVVGTGPRREALVDGLGSRFEVERTHIKQYAVGSPIQAPVQALVHVLREHALSDADLIRVTVTLPAVLAHTVQRSRTMPDINLEYLLAAVVADGGFTYAAAHDLERFEAWRTGGGDERIVVVPDPELEPRRQAQVEVETADGRVLTHRVDPVRGSPENPMSTTEVREKAVGLMAPVVGAERAESIADAVDSLDQAPDLRVLCSLLAG